MKQPRLYGVVGNPVSHSLSPWIHRAFAAQTQKRIVYAAYQPPLDAFEACAQNFFNNGGSGLNVTVPFKPDALALANRASAFARRCGVANVLAKRNDGNIAAYNTDGSGLIKDLQSFFPNGMSDQKILLIGAGGAARAAACAIADAKPAAFCIVNRTFEKAKTLAEVAGCEAVESAPADSTLVINATSAGLAGDTDSVLTSDIKAALQNANLVYDLSYGSSAQPFLTAAKRCGAKQTCDGYGMLLWQAALSYAIWEGTLPTPSLLTYSSFSR